MLNLDIINILEVRSFLRSDIGLFQRTFLISHRENKENRENKRK